MPAGSVHGGQQTRLDEKVTKTAQLTGKLAEGVTRILAFVFRDVELFAVVNDVEGVVAYQTHGQMCTVYTQSPSLM